MDKRQVKAFWARLLKIRSEWVKGREDEKSVWHGLDAWYVILGKAPEEPGSMTSSLLHMYLFDMVLPNTLIVMTEKTLFVLSSRVKIAYISSAAASKPEAADFELKLEELSKESVAEQIATTVESVKTSFGGKRIAAPTNEGTDAKLGERWIAALDEISPEKVGLESSLNSCFVVKMSDELKLEETSAQIAARAMKKAFVKNMENALQEEKPVTNDALSKLVEKALKDPAKKLKIKDLVPEELEIPLKPVVQSGGSYTLGLKNATSNTNEMTADVIICQLVVKYKEYFAQIGRTFLINPTSDQKKAYTALSLGLETLLKALKPGASLGEVYDAATKAIAEKRPELAPYIAQSFGYGTGLQMENKTFEIKSGNKQVVQAGMTFVVTVGLERVPLKEKSSRPTLPDGKYHMLITETVAATKGESAQVFTNSVKVGFDDIMYTLGDSDDEADDDDDEDEVDRLQEIVNNTSGRRVTRSATKTEEQREREQQMASMTVKIEKAQKELMIRKAREALGENHDENEDVNDETSDKTQERIVEAFKTPEDYPRDLERNQIYCDREREAVFVPLGGFHVPFHISAIKSVTKLDEELGTILRLNFFFPTSGHTFAKDVSANMRTVMTKFPNLHYVKEMSFRSKDPHNLTRQFRQIKELQKQLRLKARQREVERDIVEQEALVLNKNPTKKLPILNDVSMRPPVRKGKCIGRLQAHENGLRFRAGRTNEIFDLIYSNIKHFILQECKEREHEVLVHFHLKHPVLINKTKTYDVQFYTEVVEASVAIDGRRRHGHDPDEIDEERREQEYKRKLNSIFRKFCRRVVDSTDELDDYDKPSPELAFDGVPFREMVTITPTLNALVNLSGNPIFCVTLDEIEHIHFERVEPSMKAFDMTIVLKSQMKPNSGIPQRISSIPMEKFDTIRTWIYEKGNISFTVGTKALKWKVVMEAVYEELETGVFWKSQDEYGEPKDLGWNVLNAYDENDEDEEEGGESESDFGESDADEEEDEDDDVDDYIDDEDEESSAAGDDSEEEGEDWDELEQQAAEDDRKRNRRDREIDEEERLDRKRRRK